MVMLAENSFFTVIMVNGNSYEHAIGSKLSTLFAAIIHGPEVFLHCISVKLRLIY